MIIENICTKKTYMKNGEEKTLWRVCGTMRTSDDGKRFIELFHNPSVTLFVFKNKTKDNNQIQNNNSTSETDNPGWLDENQS